MFPVGINLNKYESKSPANTSDVLIILGYNMLYRLIQFTDKTLYK